MYGSTVFRLRAALGIAVLATLGACDEPEPGNEDGGGADGLTFPGRCASLKCTADGICEEDASSGTARVGGIWGSGPSDVYVVGAGGMVLRFNGVRWKAVKVGVTATLHDVWGTGPTNVFVVGAEGTVLRFDGVAWKATTSGTKGSLRSVWGSGPTQIFAVGKGSTYSLGLGYDGQQWSEIKALARRSVTLLDVTGTSAKRAAAVGYYYDSNRYNLARQVACKYDGKAWTCAAPGDLGELFGAWLMPGGGNYLVGTCCKDKLSCGGMIQTGGVTSCTPGTLDRAVQYHAVWGSGPSDIWIAGAGGRLIRHAGVKGEWPRSNTGTTALLRAIWGDKKDVLVGGDHGVLLRYCGL